MSQPPKIVHPARSEDVTNELDRRLRVIEYGDPGDLANTRQQLADAAYNIAVLQDEITNLAGQIANLSSQLTVVHNSSISRDDILYPNDQNIYSFLTNVLPAQRNWYAQVPGVIVSSSDWAVAYHQYAMHGQGNPGGRPGLGAPPAIPAWPVITDPTP